MGDKMLRKKNNEQNIDYRSLNDVIGLFKKILKIAYIFIVIIAIYTLTILFKEWHIKETILVVLKIISPLFIGFFLAWLFEPIVKFLERKKIRRGLATLITYLLFIAVIALLLGSIIPILSSQINDFVKIIPSVSTTVENWMNGVFVKLDNIVDFDVEGLQESIFSNFRNFGNELTKSLPEMTVKIFTGFISGMGTILVGIVVGFYLSIGFKNASDSIITLLPKNMQDDARDLSNEVNTTCRQFVKGALFDSTLIFVVSSIAFSLCGLKAPLLFGLFCGITNIIPYAGPYIGGAPAVIVGFSQSPSIGIFTLISIVIIQMIEGNFLQALIMSKSTKLHPVTIMIGLLVFGHFFGIIGMVISTPLIGACKTIIMFFNEKYQFIKLNE